jgi:hypothetical protein
MHMLLIAGRKQSGKYQDGIACSHTEEYTRGQAIMDEHAQPGVGTCRSIRWSC